MSRLESTLFSGPHGIGSLTETRHTTYGQWSNPVGRQIVHTLELTLP